MVQREHPGGWDISVCLFQGIVLAASPIWSQQRECLTPPGVKRLLFEGEISGEQHPRIGAQFERQNCLLDVLKLQNFGTIHGKKGILVLG